MRNDRFSTNFVADFEKVNVQFIVVRSFSHCYVDVQERVIQVLTVRTKRQSGKKKTVSVLNKDMLMK